MSNIYRTIQNDELDLICFQYYGFTSGSVEAVLGANRDLAKELPLLQEGIEITLPEIEKPVTTVKRLWD